MKKLSDFVKRTLVLCLVLSVAILSALAQQDKSKDKSKDKKEQSATSATSTATTMPSAPARDYGAIISNMRFREIGPATMGGRINDIAVVESDPRIIYAATASGGIFKSINGGTSWTAIFDNEANPSIGDIAIAPSDPSIVWAGMGESNNRQSSSWGNGVYKSTDGGKTWQNTGLAETHHIARVVIHWTNPDVVYVAATGKLWGPSKERGIYKTTDGGKTWQQVLFVNEDTGATDIAMDPQSPGTLYAAMYQRRRTVFGFNGSGPGSALYKSTDGGATWKKLTNGLPYNIEGAPTPQPSNLLETGRIAVEVYRKDPNVVYILVEHANGGVFRSNDKGETWIKMGDTNPRPMYFSQIRIDPNNDQRIWLAGVTMQYSDDGGRTFSGNFARAPHADTHGIWINPNDSNHLIIGNDGGINWTFDRGRTWDHGNTIAIGQFYEVGVNMSHPYIICGGLQDNNTWCGPSMSFNPRGITNDDWFTIGGGDGFYAQPDPNDPSTVYAESQDGNLLRRDLRTGENKSIRPREAEEEKRFRFQWNSPIVISVFDSKTIYYGGNFLFKSTNRGDTWTKVSPDLTSGVDRNTLQIMGKAPDKDTRSRHDGVQQFPAITTVSESPINANLLWAGTDDGNLQVTRDGGANWKNVVEKVPGLPKGTYVSRIVASKHNEGTAYATFDGHRSGDFKVYVYMTTDFGETWKSIVSNLPQNNGVANVAREHPRNANLLFVGTEFGAYVSFDKGANWTSLKLNLPTVPVDDILVHPRENDLIFGTHGRSIWVMDDITPLEQMNETVASSDIHLFDIRNATMWRAWSNRSVTSDKVFYGANPPNGAIINFYLKSALAEREQVRVTIQDAQGQTVREYTCGRRQPQQQQQQQGGGGGGQQAQIAALFGAGPGGQCEARPGVNRLVWDLRSRSALPQFPGGGGGGPGGGGFGGFGQLGFRVDPGDYTVKIRLGDKEMSKTVKVQEDPRINFSAEDRAKKREALKQLQPLIVQASTAQFTISNLRTAVNNAIESWKRPGAPQAPDNVKKAAEDFLKKIDEAYPAWGTPPSEVTNISQAGPPLIERGPPLQQRVTQLAFAIEGYTAAPTEWEMSQIQILSQKVPEAAGVVRKLATEDLPALNKLMQEAGVPYITLPMPGGGGGPGRRPPNE